MSSSSLPERRHGRPNSREQILAAARALFVELGYPQTSMGKIAKRAGVVRATVYNNFTDKEAILREIIRVYMDGYIRMVDEVRTRATVGRSSFELIEDMIASAISWRVENAELRPLLDVAKHMPNSGWDSANASADAAMLAWLGDIHRADAKAGLTHETPSIEFATAVVYGIVEVGFSLFDGPATPERVRSVSHQLALVYWHALYEISPSEAPRGSWALSEAPPR